METDTVVMRVPATPEHLALLRTVVHYYAGRADFTLDEIDDLKMAVDESGVQMLKHASGSEIVLELAPTREGLELRVGTEAASGTTVIDEHSFSWQILRALSDDLRIEEASGRTYVVLSKNQANRPGGQSS